MTLQEHAVLNLGFMPIKSNDGHIMYYENASGDTIRTCDTPPTIILCGAELQVRLDSYNRAEAWITEGPMTQKIIMLAPTVLKLAAEYNRLLELQEDCPCTT
jgi:hypothetical protein